MSTPTPKRQFIAWFEQSRRNSYKAQLLTGEMRPSEAAMGLVDAPKEGARLWRSMRRAGFTQQQILETITTPKP